MSDASPSSGRGDRNNATRPRRAKASKTRDAGQTPVVALGASAGGVQQLSTFLETVAADTGAAFVIIQHLSPDHESNLAHILGSRTQMPVHPLDADMRIEPNQVFVLSPGHGLSIGDGVLKLVDVQTHQRIRTPIDQFFRALAPERDRLAIGIVLSGTGSDGALGLKAIKEWGGVTMVQTPSEADFADMPRIAAETVAVDYILGTKALAHAVENYLVRHKQGVPHEQQAHQETLPDERLGDTLRVMRSLTHHDFSHYKPAMLSRRITRRMNLHDIDDTAQYNKMLREDSEERTRLFRDLLISVTDFFRDPRSFTTLAGQVIPALIRDCDPDDTIRAWTPGCATGEEAYSLAMLLSEQIHASGGHYSFRIFASDIDDKALEVGRIGRYPETIAADLSPERLRLFFTHTNNRYQIKRELRERVVFAVQSLIADPPYSKLDLITCRNLLIYLDADTQRRIIAMFHFALREGGYLFLGNSESIGEHVDLFEPVSKKDRIFRRIGPTRRDRVDFPIAYGEGRSLGPTEDTSNTAGTRRRAREAEQIAQDVLLRDHVPATVLINRKMEILCGYGPTQKYLSLPFGESTLGLIEMAHEDLRNKLRAVTHKAFRDDRRTALVAPRESDDGARTSIRISARPLHHPEPARGLLLVLFEETAAPDIADLHNLASGDLEKELAEELQATREQLQSTIQALEASNEDLKGSNEEIMSMNEELQSTNEELETSKEELQSMNEELTTVNHELQEKVQELEHAHNDLSNLFASTEMGTLVLDGALRIKRFTPAVKRLLNIIASDTDRPLSDFSLNFDDPDLLRDADAVLEDLAVRKREVTDVDGRWYLRRILPYRTHNNVIQGVVITFADITEVKEAALELAHSEERLDLAVAGIGGGIHDMQLDPAAPERLPDRMYLSPRLKALLGYQDDELPDSLSAWRARILPEDVQLFDAAVRDQLSGDTDPMEVEYRIRRRDGGVRWFSTRGKVIFDESGQPIRWVGVECDITVHKGVTQSAHEAEAQLRLLANSLPALIAYVDVDQRYQFHNAAHGEWFDTTDGVLTNRSMSEVLDEAAYARMAPHVEAALAGRNVTFETTLNHIALGERAVQVSLIPHKTDGRGIAGFYSLISDITDAKRREKGDSEQQAELSYVHRVATMGEMATSLAHELNQPLGAITTYVGGLIRMLRAGTRHDEAIPILQKIAEQARSAADIVRGVRELVDRGQQPHTPVDVNELLRKAVSLTEGRSRQIAAKTRLEMATNLPAVRGAAVELEQVLINLISNALEAMEDVDGERQLILCTAVHQPDDVEIMVKDSGEGISADRLTRVFEAFHSTKPNGMGMGLSISRSIVEAHGGRMWADSILGQGARFYVRLPTAKD